MKGLVTSALLVVLAACAPAPEPSELFTVARFLDAGSQAEVHGWKLRWYFAHPGERLHWTEVNAAADSVVVQPGFEDGQPVAWVMTELWYRWPNPWEQPAYHPLTFDLVQEPTVFGVGTHSTFYSPFWRLTAVQEPEGFPRDSFHSAQQVLDARLPLVASGAGVCPIVPAHVGLGAGEGAGPVQPLTGEALVNPPARPAWLDRQGVFYLGLPEGYRVDEEGRVQAGNLYRFVGQFGEDADPLPLPAVLPSDSARVGLFREVRVVLPKDAAVFLPGGVSSDLVAADAGTPAPIDPAILANDGGTPFIGRVALGNGACFASQATFSQCAWLDSEAALRSNLGPGSFLETENLVTVARVPKAGP